MRSIKILGIIGLMILAILMPILMVSANSSWAVEKNDELNFSLSLQIYDENNTLVADSDVSIKVIIQNVEKNITYNASCDVNDKVGDWGIGLKNFVDGINLTSSEEYLSLKGISKAIIYEASYFQNKENDWQQFINYKKECFWTDVLYFTCYSAEEITNMVFSSSYDALGYEITASWYDYKNLRAGNYHEEIKYSEDGILLKYHHSFRREDTGWYDYLLKSADLATISSFPVNILVFCSFLGTALILLKKR